MTLPFAGDNLSRLGALMLIALLLCGALGLATDLFGKPNALAGPALRPPSLSLPLGSDNLGRSVLARTVAGVGQSVVLASGAVVIAMAVGALLGMCAGYFRGIVDEAVARLADAMFAFPAVVVAILVSALLGSGARSAIASVVLVTLPIAIRIVRSETIVIAGRDYVLQSRIAGAGPLHILATHIGPNVAGAIIVQAAYSISFGMIIESGVSFLGLGVQPPDASLGSLILEGRPYLRAAPWLVFAPGVTLALTILSINLIGDGLRRSFGPEHRMSLLALNDLAVEYVGSAGRVRSLDGVCLAVESGEIVALLGESGSGKSTLAAAVGHFPIPGMHRVSGSVRIEGREIAELTPPQLRRLRRSTLGFIFQNPVAALDPTIKIGRQVALAAGVDAHAAARALDGFGFADIDRLLRSYPHEVSGGMAQRVTIAMLIERRPRLIVADEPTAALDAPVRAKVLEFLVAGCRRLGAALMLVTHDLQSARTFADRAFVMYAGRIVESGDVDDVLDRPKHPYTSALLHAAVGRERRGERVVPIPGLPPHPIERQELCAFAPRCVHALDLCRAQRPEPSARHGDVLCHRVGEVSP